MMNKQRVLLASAAIIAGFLITTTESLFCITAHAEATKFSPDQVVGISLSQGKVVANATYISNIIPGNTESDTLEITNTGSRSEYITIQHTLIGNIFKDNGKYGTLLGTDTDNDGVQHGISIDYEATNKNPNFEFDDHPLQITYDIHLTRLVGEQIVAEGPFSTDNTSPAFELASGQSAYVTYTYKMPIEAHNDYQGTCGKMDILVNAMADETPPGPPSGPPGSPPNTPPVTPPVPPTPPPGPPTPPPGPPPGPPVTPPGGHTTPPSKSTIPSVVPGGTAPVTGIQAGVILVTGVSLMAIGTGLIFFRRKPKQFRDG
ncbi:hypothetical protein [Alicyclobacillus dauci]|uniref:LPXTG-motif cell wall anchor domain-containing protein n=1 Tax=Alicyclobacillus dauci TaxID=1475485 RepID=A0ABY6Z1K5_9BACL|nr:hypothetical protein [Alicyclobacillus dauci]WAH36765.1 hypothetical protein NZD86_21750 [Alicyclobacillus dauci]